MLAVEVGHFKYRERMAGGAKGVTETEIHVGLSVVLALNRLMAKSINFPTNHTCQHPSGLEYLWPPDVQGLLLTCLLKVYP